MKKSPIHNLFYISPERIADDTIIIGGKELHHLKNVLRKRAGDTIFLTDGDGHRYKGAITKTSRSRIHVELLDKIHIQRTAIVDLTLAFVPLKGVRNDFIIEKGTELGVERFVAFKSMFSAVPGLSSTKLNRLRNIAVSAMLQSQRYYMPDIIYQDNLTMFLKCFNDFDCVLLADRDGEHGIPADIGSILYIVGPEGGFDASEIERFIMHGARLLSLGQTRLRSETAAVAGVVKILTTMGAI